MDSDNDSGNSNDGPIHRRRTQGTRPPPQQLTNSSSKCHASNDHQTNPNVDRTYHPVKEDAPYSDDDEVDEEDEDEDDDDDHRRHHQQSTYRGRGTTVHNNNI